MRFEDFEPELQELKPTVREKAIEIAEKLVEEEGYPEDKAIAQGIKEAEEWFLNMEG